MTDAKIPPDIQETIDALLKRQTEIYLQAVKDLTIEADATRKDEVSNKAKL